MNWYDVKPTCNSQLTTFNSQLATRKVKTNSQLTTRNSQLTTRNSRIIISLRVAMIQLLLELEIPKL